MYLSLNSFPIKLRVVSFHLRFYCLKYDSLPLPQVLPILYSLGQVKSLGFRKSLLALSTTSQKRPLLSLSSHIPGFLPFECTNLLHIIVISVTHELQIP